MYFPLKTSRLLYIIQKKKHSPRPRAATLVAINTFILPFLKSDKASSRCDCLRSPWIEVVGWSDSDRNDAKKSAVFLVSTKTIVPRGSSEFKSSINLSRFLNLPTSKTFCVTSLHAPPTCPIARKMYSCKYFPAKRWIVSGKVAENMSVWRFPVGTIVGFCCSYKMYGKKIKSENEMHFHLEIIVHWVC